MPYILRCVKSEAIIDDKGNPTADSAWENHYISLGDAYVHGLMEGEVYHKDRLETITLI